MIIIHDVPPVPTVSTCTNGIKNTLGHKALKDDSSRVNFIISYEPVKRDIYIYISLSLMGFWVFSITSDNYKNSTGLLVSPSSVYNYL